MGEQLNSLDATFLELEELDQGAHMHIGVVMVFEPRPGGKVPPSLPELAARLDRGTEDLPRFTQRLSKPTTGGLSWPSWEDDEGFRVQNHLRAARLPEPGGEAELLDWLGEFYSERLDRTRPLWEMVVVDGLEGGRWALVSKTHHCMIDGVGSAQMGHFVVDTERNAAPGSRGASRRVSPSSPPSLKPASTLGSIGSSTAGLARLPLRAASQAARSGAALLRGGAGLARHPGRGSEALKRSRALVDVLVHDEIVAAPRTSLNAPTGAKRLFGMMRAPLSELKEVKGALGGTVNDVVLAVATGGLRRLLIERGEELPERGLRAMVPVNLRETGEELAMGNRVTSLYAFLPVAVEDPLERYEHQVHEDESLKSGMQALGTTTLIDLTQYAPPVIHSFLARSLFATRLFNVTITNIPGPQQPLYGFGARMTEAWPLVPIAANHAFGLAVTSYDGNMFFGLNADRSSMPDLGVLAEGMRDSLAELLDAARAQAARSPAAPE